MAEKKSNPSTGEIKKESSKLLDFIQSNTQTVLFVLMGLICFIIFKDFIFFKKIYLFKDIGSDSINMYVPWFNCFADYLKNEGVPGWSFQQGMGQNIFPLWLGDFFSNFMMLFDKKYSPYSLAYLEIVKIILSGFVFYKFLKELKLSNYVSLLFALAYAFSGFMIMGGSWVIYSIEALYVAIILYGFERWLNQKKLFWFVAGIALLTFLQPALLLPYTIFFAAYFTVRYFDINEKGGKDFIFFLIKTAALAALGVAITGYQLLPNILQIIESPRVGGESSFFDKLQNQSMFSVAEPLLRFTTIFRSFGTDMIGNGNNFRGWYNYLEAPLFYCGIMCLVIFPQFFITLNKKQKKIYGIVTFLFFIPLIFPYFRYLFWAFSGDYFRTFSLVIVLFLIIYSARALDFIEQQTKVNKITLGATIVILLLMLFTPAAQFKAGVNDGLRGFAALLLIGYGFFAFRLGTSRSAAGGLKVIFLIVCVIELAYFSHGTINDRTVLRKNELTDRVGYNDYTIDAVKFLKEKDKNFFRINKDYFSGLAMHGSINDAKAQGYYGTASYHSFNQKNYIRFLGDFGVIKITDELSTRWANGLMDRQVLFSLCAGKYWLSKRSDNAIANMGYDSLARFGDVKVLRNRYYAPLGLTYSKIMTEQELKNLSPIQKDFAAIRACVIGENDVTDFNTFKRFSLADTAIMLSYDNLASYLNELKKDTLNITRFSENNIAGTIAVNEPRVLFLSFPFDEGWKAKVDNADTKLYRVNSGLTGLVLNKGNHQVELSFEPRLKNKGALLSVASLILLAGLLGFNRFKKSKTAENQA